MDFNSHYACWEKRESLRKKHSKEGERRNALFSAFCRDRRTTHQPHRSCERFHAAFPDQLVLPGRLASTHVAVARVATLRELRRCGGFPPPSSPGLLFQFR